MIPPPRHKQEEANVDSWLMSYADMITLLLSFFIIFVSVSEPKKEKFHEITEGIANRFGSVDLATPLQGLFRSIDAIVEDQHLLKDVAVTRDQTTIEMELSTIAFYKPESVEFNPDKLHALTDLANAFKSSEVLSFRISIEGYTSDLPVHTALYPSNWEFSAARAARMARFFIEQGVAPDHLKIVGYGATSPKVPNLDEKGNAIPENRSRNERIVIRLERMQ